MKNIAILLILCSTISLFGQNRTSRSVGTFTKVSLAIPGNLYLQQGDVNAVELEGKQELLDKVETIVDDGKLIIRQETIRWNSWKSWNERDVIDVYVTMKDFDGAAVSGSGKLIGKSRFKGSNVELRVSGSGSLEIEISAGDVESDVSGSGRLNLKGSVTNLESDISGSGRIDFNGSIGNLLDIDISGSGSMNVSGDSKQVKTNITGSGRVLAENLSTESCDTRISGSGSIRINVKTKLDAEITGSGSVMYYGNPSQVNSHTTGSGSVKKVNL